MTNTCRFTAPGANGPIASKDLDLPLFPGYLFCRFDVQVRLPILTTLGVISIVGTGKIPVPIPDQEIDAIQTMIRSDLHVQPWPQLVVGSRVLIEQGPLKGLEGVALDIKKKYRLFVSVPLLQRSVSVEIDREWVRPLSTFIAPRSVSSAGEIQRSKVLSVAVSSPFRTFLIARRDPGHYAIERSRDRSAICHGSQNRSKNIVDQIGHAGIARRQ